MSNIKSQIKRNEQNKKLNNYNRKNKTDLKKAIKTLKISATKENLAATVKKIDSLASKKVISKNKASNMKSKIMKANNKVVVISK